MSTYSPRAGSVADRALTHLRTLAPRAELSNGALAEAIGVEPNVMSSSMAAAVSNAAVYLRKKGGHQSSPVFWSLHDHAGDGPPQARQPAPSEPRARKPALDEHADMPVRQIVIPANGAPPLPIVPPLFPPLAKEDAQAEPATTPAATYEVEAADSERAGAKKPAPAADPLQLRIALWSDGSLELRRGSSLMTLLLPDETRALLRYLDHLAQDVPIA